ncbi:hypothetical protein D3C73_1226680 [compost metagenome]
MPEQLQIDHRPLLQALDHHEQPQQQGAAHEAGVGDGVVPADPVGFDQAPDQAQQAGAEGQAAPRIEARSLGIAGFRHRAPDHNHQHQPHRQVEIEDPAPTNVFGDQAAQGRRRRHRHAHATAPECPGLGPFDFIVEGVADGGER